MDVKTLGVTAHACNPSAGKVETGGSLVCSRPVRETVSKEGDGWGQLAACCVLSEVVFRALPAYAHMCTHTQMNTHANMHMFAHPHPPHTH